MNKKPFFETLSYCLRWMDYQSEILGLMVIEFLTGIINLFQAFGKRYPNLNQNIQLSVMYCFAMIDLVYSLLSTVYALGYYSEVLDPVFPLIQAILRSPFLQFFASPEKVFIISYVVLELMVVQSVFGFSKLVRYNIILLFSVLMLQGLAISYWDLLFHRDIPTPVVQWSFEQAPIIGLNRLLAALFFLLLFSIFFVSYIVFYFTAVQGQYFRRKGFEWLTDSVSFWLKLRTPTMRKKRRKPPQS